MTPVAEPSEERRASEMQPTVLVVDDDSYIVGLYAAMLDESYSVITATDGEEALNVLSPGIDVVLLDRRMPSLSGDEVLAKIRDRNLDCQVGMVTAVDPAMDIVDLDFDAYLVKPVRRHELVNLVETLLLRREYSNEVQELLAVSEKLTALETQFSASVLERRTEYQELRKRKQHLEKSTQQHLSHLLDVCDHELVYRDLFGRVQDSPRMTS